MKNQLDHYQIFSGQIFAGAIGVAVFVFTASALMTTQAISQNEEAGGFAEIATIIATRCAVCHSATPTQRGYITPPNGVAFDTAEQIKENAAKIELWAIKTKIMPLNNATEMTDDEREILAAWITAGADISN